jgi:hypothetical protein
MAVDFLDKIGGTLDRQLLIAGVFPVFVGAFAMGGAAALVLGLEGAEAWYQGRSGSTQLSFVAAGTIALILAALMMRVLRAAIVRLWSGEAWVWPFGTYCVWRQIVRRFTLIRITQKRNDWENTIDLVNSALNGPDALGNPPPADPAKYLTDLAKDALAEHDQLHIGKDASRPKFDALVKRLADAKSWSTEQARAPIHETLSRVAMTMDRRRSAESSEAQVGLDIQFGALVGKPAATRLGNVLRAIDLYPYTRYLMEGSVFWPLLETVMKKTLRDDIRDQRTSLDTTLSLATIFACLAIVLFVGAPWVAFSATLSCMMLGLLYAVMALVFYNVSVHAALTLGRSMRAACDLHRLDLMQTLGRVMPGTLADEMIQWQQLSQLATFGNTESFVLSDAARPKVEG